jgi:hypothetical protein
MAAALALVLAAACSFDPGGSRASGGDDDGGADDVDARECPEPIHAGFSINGVPAGSGDPLVTVRIGDTLTLDAGASCTASGAVQYAWTVSSPEMAATALPGLTAQSVDVFAPLAGETTITLVVSDATSSAEPVTAMVTAVGWAQPTWSLDVRGVAVAQGTVWMAATGGAFFASLIALDFPPGDVNDLAEGDDDIPSDLSAAHADGSGFVWFGHKPADGEVWRVDVDPLLLAQVDAVDFRAGSGIDDAAVRDIDLTGAGVTLATSKGVVASANFQTFGLPLTTADTHAVSGDWAGGAALYGLAGQGTSTPFGDGDNKIRALSDLGATLWVGGDGKGVARFDTASETADEPFVMPTLPSNNVRALVVDPGGDVWAATDKGIARFKQDRQAWFAMAEPQGLDDGPGAIDVRALVAGSLGGTPFVLAGTQRGLAILQAP